MFKPIGILIQVSFFLLIHVLPAQKIPLRSKILLYYVDAKEREDFMVPFIEMTLKEMKYATSPNTSLYNVNSLNAINRRNMLEGKVSDIYEYLNTSKKIIDPKIRKAKDDSVIKELEGYDQFLYISIRKFESLLEYQFILYDSVAKTTGTPFLNYYLSSSVFVDPRSTTYKAEILFALKQVCLESNQPPRVSIKANTDSDRNVFYFAKGDTVSLTAVVDDIDSPDNRFIYQWQALDSLSVVNRRFTGFNGRTKSQSLVFSETGEFALAVTVSDGISRSLPDTFRFQIIESPEITNVFLAGANEHYEWIVIDDDYTFNSNRLVDNALPVFYRTYISPKREPSFFPVNPVMVKLNITPPDTAELRIQIVSQRTQEKSTVSLRDLYALPGSDTCDVEIKQSVEYGKKISVFVSGGIGKTGSSAIDTVWQGNHKLLMEFNRKSLGIHYVYITAMDHGIGSEKSSFALKYQKLFPISFSFGLKPTWYFEKSNSFTYINYQNYAIRCHISKYFILDYAAEVPGFLDKENGPYGDVKAIYNINHTFSLGFWPSALWKSSRPEYIGCVTLDLTNFSYPFNTTHDIWAIGGGLYSEFSRYSKAILPFVKGSFLYTVTPGAAFPKAFIGLTAGVRIQPIIK